MTQRLFKRAAGDKAAAMERAYFDADRGCIELALERMADIRVEFPRDAVLEYAEGCLRKDSLGQGRRALQQFRLAQEYEPTHLFSAFNAAKYASSEEEYRARSAHARHLAPADPDLRLFDEIDGELAAGRTYGELLSNFVALAQQHAKYGDCAAASELAIGTGDWSRPQELDLRRARCWALRELDRTEESARQVRREDYPPRERLALAEALAELELVLDLDPCDPKMLNFKSAWLVLMRQYEGAIAAADAALAVQPTGYLKPLTNKSLALARMGRHDEAGVVAASAIEMAKGLGAEFDDDVTKARGLLESLRVNGDALSDHEQLAMYAKNCMQTAKLTAEEAENRWGAKKRGFRLAKGIQKRCARYGQRWHPDYISQTAEIFHDFCPEWVLVALFELGNTNQAAFEHFLHAALFVAAQAEGVMARDACQFNVLIMFGALEPQLVRSSYREAVLAPAAVDARFAPLAGRMRAALDRLHPELPRLVADQSPIDASDRQRALTKTLSRFAGDMTIGSPTAGRRGCALALVGLPFLAIRRWLP